MVDNLPKGWGRRGMPEAPVRLLLLGPCGPTWTWDPFIAAADLISGAPQDSYFLVPPRRRRHDSVITTRVAAAWQCAGIIQAFADPSGAGREPLR
jgi:hypothetical protein